MYVPSQKTLDKILISLSVHSKNELALPGNWSPTLFVKDLFDYPVESKEILSEKFQKGLVERWTYRKFFEESRGVLREAPNPEVWDIFDKGQLMMTAEHLFLDLISKSEPDKNLMLYLKALSSTHISEWNSIVKRTGAICWQFFLKSPESYIDLISSPGKTDSEMIKSFHTEFSPVAYPGKIHPGMSRAELTQIFESYLSNSSQVKNG